MKQLKDQGGQKIFVKSTGSVVALNKEQAKQVGEAFNLIKEVKLTSVGKILKRLGINSVKIQ